MIRKFRETDLDSIMKLWLETNISAHDFIDEKYWQSKICKSKTNDARGNNLCL